MSAFQKWLIIAIILTPSLIGVCMFAFDRDSSMPAGKKIGVIRIFDVIYSSEEYIEQLSEFRKDKTVAGVLLRIDSPGGAVAPSQEIYAEVLRYRNAHKPLVVSMGNIAASGGYYIASPAQRIFANPGTITGSIGVIFQFPTYYELFKKVGIGVETVKAGRYKDAGNPARPMSSEERAYLRDITEDTHEQFITDVNNVRDIDLDSLRKLADGRIFTGRQAKQLGLIDTLGGFADALAFLRSRVRLPENAGIVEKKPESSFLRELLFESVSRLIPGARSALQPTGCYFLADLLR